MDYRDRYPDIKHWSGDCLAKAYDVFPFDHIMNVSILETIAPDMQTKFLGIIADTHQAEDFVLSARWYLIESSAMCPLRKAFVIGELTWEEFWTSRPWLIELSTPDNRDHFGYVRYVPAEYILRDLKDTFLTVNHKSPLILKHETLKWQIKYEFESVTRKNELQLELKNFEDLYGQYLFQQAA